MADAPARFRVVDGGEEKKPYARSHADGCEQIVCRTCEIDTGLATSHFIKTLVAPMERRGRMTGGTPSLVCVPCLARGKVTTAL